MSGSQGLRRERVAELLVSGSEPRRGSGYRVTATAVLTAAHVVDGAESVRVRFEADLPGEWTADAVSWWCDHESDIAVVSIAARPDEEPVAPARFGRVDDRAAVLSVHAVGFPLWKLRADGATRYRDAYHVVGTVPVLSNWREGTLEVGVEAVPRLRSGRESPWEGMSGAAVWAAERIIGVLARHHPSDGVAQLAAIRIDRALATLDPAALATLRSLLPSMPANTDALPDVVPVEHHSLLLASYRAQVQDIAPRELYERSAELDELVRFCSGETDYLWWQAEPWAGKSALLSWFALHPPAGTDVVSFFITSRLRGQSDSDAFLEAVLDQLAVLNGESHGPVEPRARPRHLLRLLGEVGARCAAAGRWLVLLVDGLDEDTSRPAGMVSIAALLPRRPLTGVSVLVASRPQPGLPGDVPADHPLRAVAPRSLRRSAYALGMEIAAKDELNRLLHDSELGREVLGLVTACGGGLTTRDLEELTGRAAYELNELFGSVFGRTIQSRAVEDTPSERGYLFAHETLRQTAVEQYGASIATYRARLGTWAEHYRGLRWPPNTPAYLLRGYPRLLAAEGDIASLVAHAVDEARQQRLLAVTGGYGAAATEVDVATGLILRADQPDFASLLRLAVARDSLAACTEGLPTDLPAVWIALGQPHRAIALATGIGDPYSRMAALPALLRPLAAAGERGLAAALVEVALSTASQIHNLGDRHDALKSFAVALARIDDQAGARRLLDVVAEQARRAPAVNAVAAAAAAAGNLAAARGWIATSTRDWDRLLALSGVAAALANRGDIPQARELAEEATSQLAPVPDPNGPATEPDWNDELHAYARCLLAEALAGCGERDRAHLLFAEAESAVFAGLGGFFRARDRLPITAPRIMTTLQALRFIYRTRQQGSLDDVQPTAEALALEGNARAAIRLLERITNANSAAIEWALLELTMSVAGHADSSAELAQALTDSGYPPWVRAPLHSGLDDLVERSALGAPGRQFDGRQVTRLAGFLAVAGEKSRATRLALAVEATAGTSVDQRTRHLRILGALAQPLAVLGDSARLERLADVFEAAAAEGTTESEPVNQLIGALHEAGNHRRAGRLELIRVGASPDPDPDDVLAWTAEAGDRELTIRSVLAFPKPAVRISESIGEAERLVEGGAVGLAARLLHTVAPAVDLITEMGERILALVQLARAELVIGHGDHAERLARVAHELINSGDARQKTSDNLGYLATVVAQLDLTWAHTLLDAAESLVDVERATAELAALVSYARLVGDHARAVRLTGKISTARLHDDPSATIAAANGDYAEADRIVSQINDPAKRARAWTDIAEIAFHAGDHASAAACANSAVAAARGLPQPNLVDDYLWQRLAVLTTRLDDHASARTAIRAIHDPEIRAYGLDTLIAITGDTSNADLVAEILTTSEWKQALLAVAQLDPTTVANFCDAHLE